MHSITEDSEAVDLDADALTSPPVNDQKLSRFVLYFVEAYGGRLNPFEAQD